MASDIKATEKAERPSALRRMKSAKMKGDRGGRSEPARAEHDGELPLPERNIRVRSVIETAQSVGLLAEKHSRITGRVSADLVRAAKVRTGIRSDTDLIEFALANLAIDDGFVEAFRSTRATVPRDVDLEF